jgi:CRISPR type III-A-associated RAMP protein Csm5
MMKFEIEIKTPTVITTGEQILNTDLYEKDGNVYRVRIEDLFVSIDKIYRDEFRKKYIDAIKNKNSYIKDMYKDIKVDESLLIGPKIYYKNEFITYREIILDYISYIKEINGKYYYLPYIPGSTIKGAIKNSIKKYILNYLRTDNYYDVLREFQIFRESKNYQLADIFRFIQFSDFMPIDEKNLSIGLGLVKRVRNQQDGGKIPQYTFYLLPGTRFVGEINVISKDLIRMIKYSKKNNLLTNSKLINEFILNNMKNDNIDEKGVLKFLMERANEFTIYIFNKYKNIFENCPITDSSKNFDGKANIFIGRFKGIYLNIPNFSGTFKTYPVLFTYDNKRFKMGHIQIYPQGGW